MPQVFNIAPRVLVYPHGTVPPAVEEGWLALPQLPLLSTAKPATALEPSLGSTPLTHVVFGDGSHPTTRLCAAAVDLLCRQRPGMAVLDVGTGTGILARIARARGATFVAATDIDPAAVACARAHAELDTLDWRGAATGARQFNILFGAEAPDHWGARFDLVVANILEAPLRSLAQALRRALRPGGVLVISGFTRPQVPALRLVYETAGLQSAGDFSLDEWVLLKFVVPGCEITPGGPCATIGDTNTATACQAS
jgi:ribosomal protein L11 methylase PrmA